MTECSLQMIARTLSLQVRHLCLGEHVRMVLAGLVTSRRASQMILIGVILVVEAGHRRILVRLMGLVKGGSTAKCGSVRLERSILSVLRSQAHTRRGVARGRRHSILALSVEDVGPILIHGVAAVLGQRVGVPAKAGTTVSIAHRVSARVLLVGRI